MILSRFWYFLLAAAAAAAMAAALLAQTTYNRQQDTHLESELVRDRLAMELSLRLEARKRLDAIAPIAAHKEVRNSLSKVSSSSKKEVPAKLRKQLTSELEKLNEQLEGMAGDLLFAVDDSGIIAAQVGGRTPPKAAGLGAFPLVRRALAGYVRDDVWVYNDTIYRMAARPVIHGGDYVGAIVHGKQFDNEFAQRLAERLSPGASVGFYQRDEIVAHYMSPVENAARSKEMAEPLGRLLDENQTLADKGHTEPVKLGKTARGIYSLITGSARHADIGYVIARPRNPLASPWAILQQASAEDVAALPWVTIGGAAIALFLLGMLWMWLERDRPFRRFRRATQALASRDIDRLDITEFGGAYRKVAERINEAMDRAVNNAAQSAPKRKPADLDEILGPAPESGGGGPQYFGFAQDEEPAQASEPGVPPPPPSGDGQAQPPAGAADGARAGDGGAAPPPPPSGPTRSPSGAPAGSFASNGEPPPAPSAPKSQSGAEPPEPPPPPRQPQAAGTATAGSSAARATAPDTPAAGTPQPQPAGPDAPGGPQGEDDEGATQVADVPDDLLAASADEDEEERHFREVFEQFKQTKEQCGEPTAALTYDKFKQTLLKNRNQIQERHGAKKVRFTVYVKEGKAALKATPVKQ